MTVKASHRCQRGPGGRRPHGLRCSGCSCSTSSSMYEMSITPGTLVPMNGRRTCSARPLFSGRGLQVVGAIESIERRFEARSEVRSQELSELGNGEDLERPIIRPRLKRSNQVSRQVVIQQR